MTDSTGSDVQSAVFLAMRGSPELATIVGTKFFDDVPHEQEVIDTAFPRIVADGYTEKDAGADRVDMSEFTITIHAYSRYLGKMECQSMLSLIRKAVLGSFASNSHAAKTGKIVLMMFDYSDGPRREADGKTYHGAIRFRGLIQYGGS